MPSTRTGKIARLPQSIREELGHRLENGEPGIKLVEWLNHHKDVKAALKEHFGGRPITKQNLSEWKSGGHAEWLRQRETECLAGRLVERSNALGNAVPGQPIGDRFAGLMAMEFTRLAEDLLDKESDPEQRWQRLCKIQRELSRFRRDDHQGIRAAIQRERWLRQAATDDVAVDKKDSEQRRRDLLAPIYARMGLRDRAEKLGNTEWAWDTAALMQEVDWGLEIGRLGRHPWPCVKPDGSESMPVPAIPQPSGSNPGPTPALDQSNLVPAPVQVNPTKSD
jgi:hypothetical protein